MTQANYCLSMTRGICSTCGDIVNAKIVSDGEQVFLRKLCPKHTNNDALIANNVNWYLEVMNSVQIGEELKNKRPIKKGCPYDCGPCAWHEASCTIPVFSITNACNMDCPICFTYNRPDKMYYMSKEEMSGIIDGFINSFGSVDLVDITGGEPTLHPDLFELLKLAQRPEIGRITLNSNGIIMAQDEKFVEKLAELGVYVILSFNTLHADTSQKIHGRNMVDIKLKALENLENYNVPTTLLAVAIKGLNDNELGDIAKMVIERDFLRSFTVQNMTFTGQGGSFGC